MKRYSAIYYLLFVLLIMGAFASMAQNAYGLKICGVACLGFAVVFSYEIFVGVLSDSELYASWITKIELSALALVAIIFMLRAFSLDYAVFNLLLSMSLLAILALLLFHAWYAMRALKKLGRTTWTIPLALYYCAISLFVISWLMDAMAYPYATHVGGVALIVTIGFLVSSWIVYSRFPIPDSGSIWDYIRRLRNKSAILLVTCILLFGYNFLYSAGTLPPLYHGTLPAGYHELVEESKKGGSTEGRQKPSEFKVEYEKFVDKHAAN